MLTARAALDAISHLLDTDPEQTAATALPILTALVRDGFLTT